MKTLSQEDKEKVNGIIADKFDAVLSEINEDSRLDDDFGMDSLDNVELIMEVEKQFDCRIPDELAEPVRTVGDVYECLAKSLDL